MQKLTEIPKNWRGVPVALAGCLMLVLPVDAAQAAPEKDEEAEFYGAILTARGTGKLTRFQTVEVQTEDDRPEYADLMPVVEEWLAKRDLDVAKRGDLVLRIRFTTTTGDEKDPTDKDFRIEGHTGTASSSRMQMTMRLRKNEKAKPKARLEMRFEFYEPGSPPIWTATVVGPDDHAARTHLLIRMTEGTMEKMGETGEFRIPYE